MCLCSLPISKLQGVPSRPAFRGLRHLKLCIGRHGDGLGSQLQGSPRYSEQGTNQGDASLCIETLSGRLNCMRVVQERCPSKAGQPNRLEYDAIWTQRYIMYREASLAPVSHSVLVWDLPVKTLRERGEVFSHQVLQVSEGRCFQFSASRCNDREQFP